MPRLNREYRSSSNRWTYVRLFKVDPNFKNGYASTPYGVVEIYEHRSETKDHLTRFYVVKDRREYEMTVNRSYDSKRSLGIVAMRFARKIANGE